MPRQPPCEIPKPGRPPTPYDKASSSTQKKVEKAAKELHLSTAEDLTKKLDEMSQGNGKVLYEKVVGPKNLPEQKKVAVQNTILV